MKRIVALLLCLSVILGLFSGCGQVSDNSDYMTKGEFFALFIEEENLYSDVYSEEEIENSTTYDPEAEIMLEWGLIDENQKKGLDKAVTKELVAQCCVRVMAFRQTCSVEIKDIGKCHDQQAVTDAVGMGIFQLENGYFDAYKQMTYDECVAAIEKTSEVERNTTFDHELDIEFQDDVEDISDVDIEDIVVIDGESESGAENASYAGNRPQISRLAAGTDSDLRVTALGAEGGRCFKITISIFEYTMQPDRYAEGKIIRWDPFARMEMLQSGKIDKWDSFAGIVKKVIKGGMKVDIILEECSLEQLVKDTNGINEASTTYSAPMPSNYQPEIDASAPQGVTLKKTDSGKGVEATMHYKFSLTDPIYEKQKWRNPSASPEITIKAKVDNFSVTTQNLGKMLLSKDPVEGTLKLDFDTKVTFEATAGGLRYSPANNGNGKFLSNLSNARWTGAGAGGSKRIKIGTIPIRLGATGFIIRFDFFMYVEMDGTVRIEATHANSYLCTVHSSGKAQVKNNSETNSKSEVNANIRAGIGVTPNLRFFSKKIVDASVEVGVNLDAKAGIYTKEDELLEKCVYATQTELDENSNEFSYCIDTAVSFEASGQLLTMESVIGKFVLETCGCEAAQLDKTWELTSSHFEDGRYMSSCSRSNKNAVEVNSKGEIWLNSYKENLTEGDQVALQITSVPVNDKRISQYGGVTIETKDQKVAVAVYDAATKTLSITAKGEGSTEIVIKIKKSKGSKKYYEQTVSVTVNQGQSAQQTSFSGVRTWARI